MKKSSKKSGLPLTWKEFVEKNVVVAPEGFLRPGQSLLTSDPSDPSKSILITNTGDDTAYVVDGKISVEVNNEDYYLSLVVQLINTARQGNKEEYRKVKKEVKRLQLENKEAKKFFQTAFKAVK